ncbi:uncharacterized protein A4U43_C06F5440 [Asparagus officinalis]|uniref:Uncharacterized protein n=1 Tax=Asparagus officinalis TaxID=4686 RepID=A0A5P1EM07_ASPOF|nr:16.0 kDa heat shock protein, peroxisomal [Asparagus officinalis]ONK66217.1 uncharacterized protein A4U43_C06F5440 [Asparagus officinalis]
MADSFFMDPFKRLFFTQWAGPTSSAPMDWMETPSSHIIRINVPGLSKDEIKIQLEEGNVLHIKGEVKEEEKRKEKEKEMVWHVMERGKEEGFDRRLGLPDNVRAEQIKARVENGVLTVVVPKEPVGPKLTPRSIPVSSKL